MGNCRLPCSSSQGVSTPLTRRDFLAAGTAAGTALSFSSPVLAPMVRFGPVEISRLIVGGNPISGFSHVSGALSREMTDYFTAANTKTLLKDCEAVGINTWQSRGDRHVMRLLNEYRLEGGKIQWIAQTASEMASVATNIDRIASCNPVGIYHHGTQTDRFWKSGRIHEAREMLKEIRQTGVQVGLGTHIPEVIDHVESEDWDLDFYMTCLYNLSRSTEEASRLAGQTVRGELFWDPDREQMLNRVRQTGKTCLIFKVYGASRHCGSAREMQAALDLVFRHAKPRDCVVIGMFPKQKEQVRENWRLVHTAVSRHQPNLT